MLKYQMAYGEKVRDAAGILALIKDGGAVEESRELVAAGDEVKARQGLVVVEAMKMENELRAGRDGRVREVAVVEGQSVDAGTLLVVVE